MAGALLNTEEITALMSAIQDGRVEPKAPRTKAAPVNYDLTSQDRVIHRQMPTLDAINEQVATMFGMGITGRTRLAMRISSGPATMLRFSEFNALLAPPATVTVLSLGKAGAQALLVLAPGLADRMIAAALGDKRANVDDAPRPVAGAADARRDFTAVERNVMRRLLAILTDAMETAWAPVLPFKPEVLRFESDPRLAVIAPANDTAVVSTFELEGAIRGTFQLALPYTAIEPARKALMSPPKLNSVSDGTFASAMRAELNQVEVDVVAVLGAAHLSVREILDLEPGHVVMLGTSEGAPLPVFIQGKAKFTGQPKVVGGALALELDAGPIQPTRDASEEAPVQNPSQAA